MKPHFPAPPTLNIFSWKFHGLVLGLVEFIDAKGIDVAHLYGCEAVRHISSETGKRCIFCGFRQFLSLCRTASQPYRLSHTNALRINEYYQPKDRSMKFSQKNIENWQFWKTQFFWVGHFLLPFHENQSKVLGYQEWVEIMKFILMPWGTMSTSFH